MSLVESHFDVGRPIKLGANTTEMPEAYAPLFGRYPRGHMVNTYGR